MKFLNVIILPALISLSAYGQPGEPLARAHRTEAIQTEATSAEQKVVVVTGARFSYRLVQQWIDDFNKVQPEIQIVIESRGSADPAKFDVLAEVYEHDVAVKETREYVYVGRYAILPVANSSSAFAKTYEKKGLNNQLIKQLYFHDIFADKDEKEAVKEPYTVYTRLQKAGVPIVFSRYFSYDQKDIQGKAIAGSDEHLLKAILRDSTGISFLPLPLIYEHDQKKPIDGLVVLPVDLDGNRKVSDDERIFGNGSVVIEKLEQLSAKDLKNVPVEYLHLSVDKKSASAEAIAFLKWVNENGQKYLHDFGYLNPEEGKFPKEKFNQFALKQGH